MSIKTVTGLLLFAKQETSYGVGASFSATDVVQVSQELPVFQVRYVNDGNRGPANWSGGANLNTAPGGKYTEGTVIIEGKGLGSAYGASAKPLLHNFLESAGLTGSLSASGWLYTPVTVNQQPHSLALNVYDRLELLPISGAFSNMSFGTDGPGVVHFTFALQGKCANIADVSSPPARTFVSASILPPKAEGVALSIGNYTTGRVRSFQYDHALTIGSRTNLNDSDGHSGFVTGRREPVFNVTIEADALSAFDPYTGWQNATSYDVSLQVGASGTNNAFRIRFPQASIIAVEKASEDPIATWNLQLRPAVSAPDQTDDIQLYFLP